MSDENDMGNNAGDSSIAEYATYEDYLDSQITPLDMYYLEVNIYFNEKLFLNYIHIFIYTFIYKRNI